MHGSTKQSPRERFEASQRPRKRKSLLELNELFLWEEERTVDKTGCVQLYGNSYEVDSALARKRVALRYDPFDLTEMQVWFEGKRYADATPVELNRKRRRPEQEQIRVQEDEPEQLSFLDLAEQKRQAAWQEDAVRYAQSKGGERG
jgi:putative transposase